MSQLPGARAAQHLLTAARGLARKHLHTKVFLPPALVLRILHDHGEPASLPVPLHVVSRLKILVAEQRDCALASANVGEAGGMCFYMGAPGVFDKEVNVLARCLNRDQPVTLVTVPPGASLAMEAAALATVILDRGFYGVTIATLEPWGATRRAALATALAALEDAPPDLLPPIVLLDMVQEHVLVAQRRHVVVDRAHRLGTAEHALWARLSKTTASITLVGCPALPAVRPGLTLGLLPVDHTFEADGARVLARRLLDSHVGAWLRDATRILVLGDQQPPGTLIVTSVDTDGELPRGMVEQKNVVYASVRRLLARRDDAAGTRLVIHLPRLQPVLTCYDWLTLLTSGWAPSVVVAETQGNKDAWHAALAACIDAAPAVPRAVCGTLERA